MKKIIEAAVIQKQDVIMAIDISGGKINYEHLKTMIDTFKVMVDNYNYFGHVLLCDNNIREEFEIDDIEDLATLNLDGKAGTDYTPVFNYAKDKVENAGWNIFKIYYMTDGYGTFPESTEFDKDTIWVAGNKHGDFPFGEIAEVDIN